MRVLRISLFTKISKLFRKFKATKYSVRLPGLMLMNNSGEQIGYVDQIIQKSNRFEIVGWTLSGKIGLQHSEPNDWVQPNILRSDVNLALGLDADRKVGFEIQGIGDSSNRYIFLDETDVNMSRKLPQVRQIAHTIEALRISVTFVHEISKNWRLALKAWRNPTTDSNSALKVALGLHSHKPVHPAFSRSAFGETGPCKSVEISIIVPVFNALEAVKEALRRVVENTDVSWNLVIVDDASTDQNVGQWLQAWCDGQCKRGHRVSLLTNKINLGFVGSVNRAFEHVHTLHGHVVLLNSDAFVPKYWASRLILPILEDPQVASVTPLTNDGEICTVPRISSPVKFRPGIADALDRLLHSNLRLDQFRDSPTGVGYCMALNRKFLNRLPRFDSEFGKGYGEEVDWCQKAKLLSGRNVIQPALFVEHQGGASFGWETKQRLMHKSSAILSNKYSRFDSEVQSFVLSDPIYTQRLYAALCHASMTQETTPIYIGHSLGGGADKWLKETIAQLTLSQAVIVLRTGGVSRWTLEFHSEQEAQCLGFDNDTDVLAFLTAVKNRRVIYSCGVGHPDAVTLPNFLRLLSSPLDDPEACLEILIHDYFLVSPSYTLLNSDGSYTGEFALMASDDAHTYMSADMGKVSLTQWQEAWLHALRTACQIRVFSKSSELILKKFYPDLKSKIQLSGHQISDNIVPVTPTRDGPIGCLGAIGFHKGAEIIQRLSEYGERTLHVVGEVDQEYIAAGKISQTGQYQVSQISDIATAECLSCWLIPSIWPETFSYTTHEALATGLPVFCFDLGAQADAVRTAPNGHVIPKSFLSDPDATLAFIEQKLTHDKTHPSKNPRPFRSWRRSAAA